MAKILTCLMLLLPAALVAQDAFRALPGGAIAITSCLGGHSKTVLDAAIFDSLELRKDLPEILVHEAKHREQIARYAPNCPNWDTPAKLLTAEVEAYCASRPIRMLRGFTKAEVDSNYLNRLQYQFKGALHPLMVTLEYQRGCP